eukprot:4312455-Karenia_brevis.AAC.1
MDIQDSRRGKSEGYSFGNGVGGAYLTELKGSSSAGAGSGVCAETHVGRYVAELEQLMDQSWSTSKK